MTHTEDWIEWGRPTLRFLDVQDLALVSKFERCAGASRLDYDTQVDLAHKWQPYWDDYRPGVVLFLTSKADFDGRMDRFFYHSYQAATDHPKIKAEMWGPGYNGFNDDLTLTENVIKQYNYCENVSFIFVHTGNEDSRTGKKMGWDWTGHEKCLLIEELGDCHGGECVWASIPTANITTENYGFQLLHNFYPHNSTNPKMYAHNPHCANPKEVQPLPWKAKQNVARLFGSTSAHLYPLRSRVEAGIADGTIQAHQYFHPGYGNRSVNAYQDYVQALQHSKICIFDSSIVKKAIRKFMEAFMSGCVVASDLPHEMRDLIKDNIIELDEADNATIIANKISLAMADQQMLRAKAARSIEVAMSYWTCAHKLDRLLYFASEYSRGFRGYLLPFSVTIGCNAFQADGKRAAWCS